MNDSEACDNVISNSKRRTRAAKSARVAKPNVRGDAARERILASATREFSELGFRGASCGSIAEEAGFSEPGLLHHFGSKKGLLMAVLDQRYAFDAEKLLADQELEGLSLLPLLSRLVRENLKQRESINLSMIILAESISSAHPSHDFFSKRYERARQIVSNHLKRAKARKFLKPSVDTDALASVLLAAMDGLQLQWLLDKRIDMAACFDVLISLIRVAIEPKK